MLTESLSYLEAGWRRGERPLAAADVVIYFGSRADLADGQAFASLNQTFPNAKLLGCSTGGQIEGDDVREDGATALALRFQETRVKLARVAIDDASQSEARGEEIATALQAPDLAAVFVICDGLKVNGSRLARGMSRVSGPKVSLSGGLAGDGSAFHETWVGAGEAPCSGRIGAIGFYGSKVKVSTGSAGGWDVFGPRRKITASRGSVLHELDGEPALNLYERYLGEDDVRGLPGSALLFPLRIADPNDPARQIVRTVLAVNREERTLTFAGDMPMGWSAQLMRGVHDRLVAGAADAARPLAVRAPGSTGDRAAILVSCIGRRLLMGQSVGDEVEAVNEILGARTRSIGFYSYGELSPHPGGGACELHNQTMTITTCEEDA